MTDTLERSHLSPPSALDSDWVRGVEAASRIIALATAPEDSFRSAVGVREQIDPVEAQVIRGKLKTFQDLLGPDVSSLDWPPGLRDHRVPVEIDGKAEQAYILVNRSTAMEKSELLELDDRFVLARAKDLIAIKSDGRLFSTTYQIGLTEDEENLATPWQVSKRGDIADKHINSVKQFLSMSFKNGSGPYRGGSVITLMGYMKRKQQERNGYEDDW